jgi:hypothetical protein
MLEAGGTEEHTLAAIAHLGTGAAATDAVESDRSDLRAEARHR